ncbi:hypothetical protein PINS_up006738 [Pythium insidiosum]|nr:hypothetical protein PINS_up006738 [Pythium insidiosum]
MMASAERRQRRVSAALPRATLFLVFASRCVIVAYFVAATQVYWRFPTTLTSFVLPKYATLLPVQHFRAVAVCHGVMAALHAMLALRHVFRVCRRTTHQAALIPAGPSVPSASATTTTQSAATSPSLLRRTVRAISRLNAARRAVFGVRGRFFDSIFLARELLETTLQTYQAYRVDALLTRSWLPRVFMAVLVINCWTTPLLYESLSSSAGRVRGRSLLRRLLCLLSDFLMDFVSTIIVPTVVAWSYIAQLEPDGSDFPDIFWYDDVWLIELVNESQIVLLTSVGDAVAHAVFTVNLLVSIETITSLLLMDEAPVKIAPDSAVSTQRHSHHSRHHRSRVARVLHRVGHVVMVVTGVVAVSLHLRAHARPSDPACVLAVHPWFAQQPACALLDVRCPRLPPPTAAEAVQVAAPASSVLEDALQRIDPEWLRYLIVRHCDAVVMPPRLQSFGRMIGIKIYNSTIRDWGERAALTQTHHSAMRFLFVVRTLLPNGTLPIGLLSPEYPSSLFDVELIATDLAWLPDTIETIWPAEMLLYIEHSKRLTALPPAIARLRDVMSLSLAYSGLRELPAALFESSTRLLLFGGSALQALPEDVDATRTTTIRELQFFNTNVSTAPRWLDALLTRGTHVFGGGSPLCDLLTDHKAAETQALLAARPALQALDCGPPRRALPSSSGEYPLEVDDGVRYE